VSLTFDPPDLIERAAQTENWTDDDRADCAGMLRQAFEKSFQVRHIQRAGPSLIAYDAPFSGLESVRFQENAEKPVLQALADLSKRLLRVKHEREQ
jgi:hypothetical protein